MSQSGPDQDAIRSPRYFALFLSSLLFVIALLGRLTVTTYWQFDGLYGQDSFAYYQQALALVERLPNGRLPPLDFFWPNGFPLMVAVAMLVLGTEVWSAQAVSLLAGAALAPLVYLWSRSLFPSARRLTGLLAGLVVAVAGQPLLSSVVIMADMPALFWATLAALLLTRAWQQPSQGQSAISSYLRRLAWLSAAVAALALSIITRWIFALLIPTFVVYSLYQMRCHRPPWWSFILPGLTAAVILVPQLWLSLHRPEGVLHSWLLGWHPANAWQREFETVDGHFLYRFPVALFYAQPAAHPAYLFPLLGMAGCWGAWQLWRRRAWDALILLVGWGGAVYLFLAGIPYQNFRFGLSLYPPVVLLAAYGAADLWRNAATVRLAQVGVLVSLIGMLVWAYPMLDRFLMTQNESKTIARQVEQTVPDDAVLLAFGLTLTLQHYTTLNVQELYYLDETALAALAGYDTYLLLDVGNAISQWQGRSPAVNYQWLREHAVLTPLAHYGSYTLFHVQWHRIE